MKKLKIDGELILLFGILLLLIFLVAPAKSQERDSKSLFLQQPCPKTTLINNCFQCHVQGNFKVKETRPDAHLDYPNRNTKIVGWECGALEGYYLVKEIDADQLQEALSFFVRHKINKFTMEMFSPGGSMFHGIKMTSMMDEWEKNGGKIETRVYGIAASAAFMVFVNGTKGKRLVSPQSHIMWHELISFKMFDVSTPSDKEDEGRVLRHFQNTANEWLASKSKIKKEEIDSLIRKKEFWMNGKQALEYGFADGLIGK